jgi:hypothetical protein
MLHFQCPSCQTKCEAAPEFAGKLVVCPKCGQSVSVPRDAAAITDQAPSLPAPKRETIADEDRWRGRSIAKDGGAGQIWLRNGAYVLIGATVLGICVCLVLPGTQRVRDTGTRFQSTNNLKQVVLAFHSFHDANKRLPFNGSDVMPADAKGKFTKEAVSGSFTSGSWAFQILPYLDQMPLFNQVPVQRDFGMACYMCPERGRPSFEKPGGAWTDYFYNNYLNDPLKAAEPDAPDAMRTLISITDGTSNTILAGQGNINTTQYASTGNVVRSSNIFLGGTTGTMRSGDNGKTNPTGMTLKRDSAENPGIGSWGGPFAQGSLFAMCDGTVRMFPYATQNLGAFLTPTGDEKVELPDT